MAIQTETVLTVNLILLITGLNAVTAHGMSLVSIVLLLKPIIAGIVQGAYVLVILPVNVVMVPVILMKTVKPVKLTAVYAVNVMQVI